MAKPEIRLKGFEGEWNNKPLNNREFTIVAGGDADKTMLLKSGRYPVIANALTNDGIIGYYDNYYRIKGPAVTVTGRGDVGFAQARYLSFTPVVRLLSITSSHDVYYLANAINKHKIIRESTGVPQLTTNQLSEHVVSFPPTLDEEREIGDYFKSLDSMIQGVTKKIASLKQMKQACLVSMFPQEGETTPRVRFKGFKGEWENVAMGDVFVERHEISNITNELPQLSFTIKEGVIRPEDRKTNKRDFLIKDKTNKKYLITYLDDIIYNPANVIYGAIHKNSLCNGVVSPIYKIFYTEQDALFMECVVRKPEFIQDMTVYMEGTVQKLKTLKPEAFLRMKALIASSIEEQRLIGKFFRSLDKQISLQEARLEKLKQIKSACLDKMFV